MSISADCKQYVVDKIQNSTASVCNNVGISNGKAIFRPTGPPVSYIQINNIVELSEVNVFSVATWVALGSSQYNVSFPLFSLGDLSYPFITASETPESSPYEPLACYTREAVKLAMKWVKSKSLPNTTLVNCRNYARNNNFDYFAFGSSFCRFVIL